MAEITLTAETGRTTGSRPSNRLRAEGKVPGVVYGLGGDPSPSPSTGGELRHALTTEAGLNALINLEVDGDTQLTIVKELQRHPVRRDVTPRRLPADRPRRGDHRRRADRPRGRGRGGHRERRHRRAAAAPR